MKIYEIGTGYTPIPATMGAATEIVVEELTNSFLKNGEDVQIIDIFSDNRAGTSLPIIEVKLPEIFTGTDVSLGIMHKLKRVFYSVNLAKTIKKILKKTEEKIVLHFHNQYNFFFYKILVPKKLQKKAITAYTVHSYIWGADWEEIESTVKRKYFQEIFSVKNADVVFVLNDITIKHFTEKLSVKKEKIFKILNGVNTEKYSPLSEEKIKVLKKKNDLENKKIIFQVGSVCPRKNQLGSVQMLTEYLKENKDVCFLYAGGIIDEEYYNSIIDFSKGNGIENQVSYLGELSPGEELNNYYNMADCTLFTSTQEAFGLVIIEAISSGTCVYMNNNLMFDLDGGYYIYENKNDLIDKLDALMRSGKKDSENNRKNIEKYSWDEVAKTHAEIFRSEG